MTHSPNLIHSYTRSEAIADGEQIEVTNTAVEAGIRFPVFLTRAVFDGYVAVPEWVVAQDESGRLWDILWILKLAMKSAGSQTDRIQFDVFVRNDNRAPKRRKFLAVCGPRDIDDPQPAITVMLPDED